MARNQTQRTHSGHCFLTKDWDSVSGLVFFSPRQIPPMLDCIRNGNHCLGTESSHRRGFGKKAANLFFLLTSENPTTTFPSVGDLHPGLPQCPLLRAMVRDLPEAPAVGRECISCLAANGHRLTWLGGSGSQGPSGELMAPSL